MAAENRIPVMKRGDEGWAVDLLAFLRKLVANLDVETARLRERLYGLNAAQERTREQPRDFVLLE